MGPEQGSRWPAWWDWELEISGHLLKRMIERGFSEVDLRSMLQVARRLHPGDGAHHWVVETVHESQPWRVIVEPDDMEQTLVVVTAYPVDPK
jgi:hypothetical protein